MFAKKLPFQRTLRSPIQEVIGAGDVPRFATFLQDINCPDLQFEAAWVSDEHCFSTAKQTKGVVIMVLLLIFVHLLQTQTMMCASRYLVLHSSCTTTTGHKPWEPRRGCLSSLQGPTGSVWARDATYRKGEAVSR